MVISDNVSTKNGNYFGFPWGIDESDIILLNVPWDATTTFRRGTCLGPEAMIDASVQLDFYNFYNPCAQPLLFATDMFIHAETIKLNKEAGRISSKVIHALEHNSSKQEEINPLIAKVNLASEKVNQLVYKRCQHFLHNNKTVLAVGGEHSISFGLVKALAEIHNDFGILQIDAHADLRESYMGFNHSHASTMFNLLSFNQLSGLTQVGIRDVSANEMKFLSKEPRIKTFSDHWIKTNQYKGSCWHSQCENIIASLPEKVYISFDIDGLQPAFCPNTGTPVSGGLTPEEALYLLWLTVKSGHEVIGIDLCEVVPGINGLDAIIGSRILFQLASIQSFSNRSNKKKKKQSDSLNNY